ncbi:MAG TPA: hypothetical protein VGC16_02550, partial [Rhizomicrobium sp.]
MKRLLIIAAAVSLLLPGLSLAQPGRPDNGRPDRPGGNGGPGKPGGGRPDRPVTLPAPVPGKPGGNRPGGPGDRPGRPGKPNPGGPGMRPPPRPTPPSVRPPPRPGRPQFSWRGRSFNPIRGSAWRYPSGYSYR